MERSSTGQSETPTSRAPAYMNARVRPTSPSPLRIFPKPVLQAESITSGDPSWRLNTSWVRRNPSFSGGLPTNERTSPDSSGRSAFSREKLAACYCEENGRPGIEPVLLLGISVLQFLERAPDREAI